MSNSSLVLRLRSAFNGARDASLAGLLLLGPAAAQAASLTVKNFDEDLATVYVNGATMTEVNGVACYTWTNTSTPGTLTIPAGVPDSTCSSWAAAAVLPVTETTGRAAAVRAAAAVLSSI